MLKIDRSLRFLADNKSNQFDQSDKKTFSKHKEGVSYKNLKYT